MTGGQKRFSWVYLPPLIHFCACLASMIGLVVPSLQYIGITWSFIILADLPVSLVAYALGWKYPLLANLWILTAGTLWWYLLSRIANRVFGKFRPNNVPREKTSLSA